MKQIRSMIDMKKIKPENIQYRFFIKVDHDREYRVFESRYYAEKWLYEVYLNEQLDNDSFQIYRKNGFQYEIKKADEGYVIYKISKEVI